MSIVNEFLKGRKTFFITPDTSLVPESYLEDYLTRGFECYFVDTTIFLPIAVKVDIILTVFKDSILFFNIDSPLPGDTWPNFIFNLQKKYPEALFGVIYNKRPHPADKQAIEKLYLYDIGIQCGCIQLEYQKKNNFSLIEKTLFANQAMGRRKNVRAVCGGNCFIKFRDKSDKLINAHISDISLSHFTISTSGDDALSFEGNEKITEPEFIIKGLHFRNDCVLFTNRKIEEEEKNLYVFAFTTKDSKAGIELFNRQILIPKIYEIMSENCQTLLDQLCKRYVARQGGNLIKT